MKRGEIWIAAGGAGDYGGKPRPVVIIQSDRFDTDSLTVCPFTSDPSEAPQFRLPVSPTVSNGLRESSRLMVDKVMTMRRERFGKRIGVLTDHDMDRLNNAIAVFLGLAG